MKQTIIKAALLGVRAGSASVIAVVIAQSLNLTFPLYAVVAAVVVTDLSSEQTQQLGVQRLLGTALGAVAGASLSLVFGNAVWAVGVAIFLTILVCYVLDYQEAAKMAGYVAGIIILEHSDAPWLYARDRFVETSLGIVLAIIMSLLIRERGFIPPES